MHELSLARALLKQVDELRTFYRTSRMKSVRLTVGEFYGVDTELLSSALCQSSAGTALEDVEFSIALVPLQARCRTCDTQFVVEKFTFICPACGGATDVVRGEELVLESVTFEEHAP